MPLNPATMTSKAESCTVGVEKGRKIKTTGLVRILLDTSFELDTIFNWVLIQFISPDHRSLPGLRRADLAPELWRIVLLAHVFLLHGAFHLLTQRK